MTSRPRESEIRRRVIDLLGLSVRKAVPIQKWFHEQSGVEIELPYISRAHPDDTYTFSTRIDLSDIPNTKWLLKISISGGGLLKIDNNIYQGIDHAHRIAHIPSGEHRVTIEASSRGLFGETPWVLHFDHAVAAAVNWKGFSLGIGMLEALRLARVSDNSLRKDLLEALWKATLEVDLVPSIIQASTVEMLLGDLKGVMEGRWDRRYIASVYGIPVMGGAYSDIDDPMLGDADKIIDRSHTVFEEELNKLSRKYPKTGSIIMLGHCHIDAAWLWPYSETKRKILRSFANIARLADDGYRFTFAQSSAQYYEWLEEMSKDLAEKIKEYVSRSIWIPVGGMWVESDTNLVTGESLARQFLLGQLYFETRFGKIARIGWLPDTFGFSAQLPQILRKSGIEVFVTHKIMWNDTNRFPYHLFQWEGIDGTTIPVHVLVLTYNGSATSEEIKNLWDRYVQKDLGPAIHSYGEGDGGGGPNLVMLERISWIKRLPGLPSIVNTIDEENYLSIIKPIAEKAPKWRGELYVEIHRGTYTTNHRIKELVYRAEACLRSTEIWSSIAYSLGLLKYPYEDLREAWKKLLTAQFHDVLPGSANYDAYREAYSDLEYVITSCEKIRENALASIAGAEDPEGSYIAIFNDLPWSRRDFIELPKGSYRVLGGDRVAGQELVNTSLIEIEIPPLGYIILERSEQSVSPEPSMGVKGTYASDLGDSVIIGNEAIEVKIYNDGSFSVFDKEKGSISIRTHRLEMHQDKPGDWDAWDIERSSLEIPSTPLSIVEKPRVIMTNPMISCASVTLGSRGSVVEQRICVKRGSGVVEIRSRIHWRSRGYLLKAWIEPSFEFNEIYYEIPFGVIKRRSKYADSWDSAKFEAPALRWVDISNGDMGIAIISFTKHGYSAKDNRIGLTLAKTPLFPNPYGDLDPFETTYYIYPHKGDYIEGSVAKIAYELWSPPAVLRISKPRIESPTTSFVKLDSGSAILEALKKTERGEGLVVRIYEVGGKEASVKLDLWDVFEILEADLLEREDRLLSPSTRSITIQLKPYEIKTLILRKV
ncbi:MAG TPA: glycoside hydrolase family 38 C-terminal domain-containing protein [Sulfolobales archaeon]|nr:glycoside hydrolase family 38 C-terminal domain-containing protein [Sulfolobales archaeon]